MGLDSQTQSGALPQALAATGSQPVAHPAGRAAGGRVGTTRCLFASSFDPSLQGASWRPALSVAGLVWWL